MESNIKNLKLKRVESLENILKIIRSWDKSYEMGMEIIEKIGFSLEEIKEINSLLEPSRGFVPFDELYEERLKTVKNEYGNLLEKLEGEKEKLLQFIKETGLKIKVKKSYILNEKKSIFIDKDL